MSVCMLSPPPLSARVCESMTSQGHMHVRVQEYEHNVLVSSPPLSAKRLNKVNYNR